MKVYISGAITNNPNYKEEFAKAEELLKRNGCEPVNPVDEEGKTWSEYMRRDIKLLCDCDAIYQIKGWEKSCGAKLENDIAKALGLLFVRDKNLE